MYQPYTLSENVRIIHQVMIEGGHQRNHPEHHPRPRDIDRPGPLGPLRRAAGRALIALGTRLDPAAGMPAPSPSGLGA